MTISDSFAELLPAIDPGVAASLGASLPARIQRRVSEVSAEYRDLLERGGLVISQSQDKDSSPSYTVSIDDITVALTPEADGVIRELSQLGCSCLLSPRCVHLAGVVGLARLAPSEEQVTEATATEVPDAEAGDALDAGAVAGADPENSGALTEAELFAVEQAQLSLQTLLGLGAAIVDQAGQAALLAALHLARNAKLYRLGDALSRVAQYVRWEQSRSPSFDREAYVAALADALLTTHLLGYHHGLGTVSDALRGSARRSFRRVGNLKLRGILCEPVLTATGYAGVATTLCDDEGGLWTISGVGVGTRDDVARRYSGEAGFDGLSASPSQIARQSLLISGAEASADHRLGMGKGVRAVLSPATGGWETLRELVADDLNGPVPPGLYRLKGTVVHTATHGFALRMTRLEDVSVSSGQPVLPIELSPAAIALGGERDLDRLARAQSQTYEFLVRVEARSGRPFLLAADLGDPPVAASTQSEPDGRPPEAYRGRVFFGLDTVPGSYVERSSMTDVVESVVTHSIRSIEAPEAVQLLQRWLGRVAINGRDAALGSRRNIERDVSRARRLGAPVGADLLAALPDAAAQGRRRFDGVFIYDSTQLRTTWLRLASYCGVPPAPDAAR